MERGEIPFGQRFWLRYDQLSLANWTARAAPRVFVPGLEFLPTFASNDYGHDGALVLLLRLGLFCQLDLQPIPMSLMPARHSVSHELEEIKPCAHSIAINHTQTGYSRNGKNQGPNNDGHHFDPVSAKTLTQDRTCRDDLLLLTSGGST
jgi:hypothetical protein